MDTIEALMIGLAIATAFWGLRADALRRKEEKAKRKETALSERQAENDKIKKALSRLSMIVAIRNKEHDRHTDFETSFIGKLLEYGVEVRHLPHSGNRLLLEAPKSIDTRSQRNNQKMLIIGGVYWVLYSYGEVHSLHLDMRAVDETGKVLAARVFSAPNDYDKLAFVCLQTLAAAISAQDGIIEL